MISLFTVSGSNIRSDPPSNTTTNTTLPGPFYVSKVFEFIRIANGMGAIINAGNFQIFMSSREIFISPLQFSSPYYGKCNFYTIEYSEKSAHA